jgi:hypothetical protein
MSFEVLSHCGSCPNRRILGQYWEECAEAQRELLDNGGQVYEEATVKCSGWFRPTVAAELPDDYILCPAETPRPPLIVLPGRILPEALSVPPVPGLEGTLYFKKSTGNLTLRLVLSPKSRKIGRRGWF